MTRIGGQRMTRSRRAVVQDGRLALVQQTARDLAAARSVDELCLRLADAIHARMGQHVASVFLLEGDDLRLAAYRSPATPAVPSTYRHALAKGIVGYVASTRRPYLCNDTRSDRYYQPDDEHASRAEVAVPIVAGCELIGVVNVECAQRGAFQDEDVTTLAAIADQAAIAIQNARLYEAEAELRRRAETRARRLEHIQRVGEWLKVDQDEQSVGACVVQAARDALGFRMAVLNLVDRPGDPSARGRVVATAGLPPEGEAALTACDFPLSDVQALFRPEHQLSRSYFIPSGAFSPSSEIPTWTPELSNAGENAWQAGDELLVPLTDRQGGHLLGFLSVDDPENGRRPEREEAEVLEIFTDQAVVALRNARLLAEARRLADRDPVTGLFNHRAAHARLDAEIARARACGGALGVLALDMDDFKLINDTYGHPTGDLALRHVATLLERCARAGDLAARLGGDEFLLILPGAAREQSVEIAQRVGAAAGEAPLRIDGDALLPLRFSIGIATFPDDAEQTQALLTCADRRLYEAKRAGGRGIEAGGSSASVVGLPVLADFAGFDMLSALVTAVDNKDRYTREHSEQVAALACLLADAIGLSADTQRTLRVAGLLHDVGKIGVPDRILRKPGRLEPDEWAAMKQHVALSAALVQAVVPDPIILAAVASHHERWDGRGYPNGLAGEQVTLPGRIMIVADAVSAMALDRPYRRGLSRATIVDELRRGAGSQFDPSLVEPFIRAFRAARDMAA